VHDGDPSPKTMSGSRVQRASAMQSGQVAVGNTGLGAPDTSKTQRKWGSAP